jgi:hypothetical protein
MHVDHISHLHKRSYTITQYNNCQIKSKFFINLPESKNIGILCRERTLLIPNIKQKEQTK